MYILRTGYVCMYVCKYLMYICKAGESERERARQRKMQASNAAARFRLACACECVCELCLCVPLCALLACVCVCALCLFVCTSNFCFGKNSCVSSHSLSLFGRTFHISHSLAIFRMPFAFSHATSVSFSLSHSHLLSPSLPLSFSLGVFFAQMQFTFKASIKMH